MPAAIKPETVIAICDAVRSGKTKKDVAKDLGLSFNTVWRYTHHLRGNMGPERNARRHTILTRWNRSEKDPAAAFMISRELGAASRDVIAMVLTYEREQKARAAVAATPSA